MQYHCSLDIESFLSTTKFPQGFERMLRHPNGKPMSAQEARSELFAQLKEGRTYIPVGPCDNFDFQHGCLGHADGTLHQSPRTDVTAEAVQ